MEGGILGLAELMCRRGGARGGHWRRVVTGSDPARELSERRREMPPRSEGFVLLRFSATPPPVPTAPVTSRRTHERGRPGSGDLR